MTSDKSCRVIDGWMWLIDLHGRRPALNINVEERFCRWWVPPSLKGTKAKLLAREVGRVDRNIKIKPTPTDRLVPSMHVVRLHSSPPLPLHWCLHACEGKKVPRWISQEQEQTLVFVFYFGKVQAKDAMVGRSVVGARRGESRIEGRALGWLCTLGLYPRRSDREEVVKNC